ncbi:hypothetical protein SLNWT_2357 [Streptomyces albus]|uniref:Uncharacterized protein n=2 Tax=Streptomyces TaxID=1883 RepID=A0A0B5EKA6_STRA4|nr:hypothetical protein SLNWT_2357 [Streptomyces albus]AOU77045.1 hypothetical protein SLNHY_2354 [Streptomyces albus]
MWEPGCETSTARTPMPVESVLPAPADTSRAPHPTAAALPPPPTPECRAAADPREVVTVPSRQGLEAVDILRRQSCEGVGPVLHDDDHDTLSFVVPRGTAEGWDVPGSDCTRTAGGGLPLGRAAEAPEGTDWLVPPRDADPVTDPAVLRAALGEAARTIEAADNCR